ncbi:MAG: hypothetical protein SCK70_17470, partial [bacterium]|nr:hypothetical protein [bacterium]
MARTFISLLILLVNISLTISIYSQTTARLKGQVLDMESLEPLPGTMIKLQKLDRVVFSDRNGHFEFRDLGRQRYLLECILPTYPRYIVPVQMPADGDTTITIYYPHSIAASDVFEIGGIKVEAERDLLPKEYTATTRISSGEIENLQASSLGDVLEMIPGLEKSNRLGLDKAIFANVRGSSTDRLGTFGTKIILD